MICKIFEGQWPWPTLWQF